MTHPKYLKNFGRNRELNPTSYYEPQNESEVLQILERNRGEQIRVIGSLHSWSDVLVSEGVVLNLRYFCHVEVLCGLHSGLATVGAGCQIKSVLERLKHQGQTLPSLGLITEQTIAGAISTGTHGSGRHSLSHYVDAVRVARYDPNTGRAIIETINGGDALRAARCSLGCLGVILSVRIRCREQYNIEELFREYSTLDPVLAAENEFPLQQFFLIPWRWTYLAQHRRETTSPRSRLASIYRLYWFLTFDLGLHLLVLTAVHLVGRCGFVRFLYRNLIPRALIRNWNVTDESSKMLVMKHELFRHIEIELFVERHHLHQALEFVRNVLAVAGDSEKHGPDMLQDGEAFGEDAARIGSLRGKYCHHYPICVRRVLADETLISMASGDGPDWYAISLISYARPTERQGFFHMAEVLAETMSRKFGARPHWGKWCPLPAQQLLALYPRFDDFRTVCESRDPQGVFRNRWLKTLFGGMLS